MPASGIAELAALIAARVAKGELLVVGVTGSVAAGKSTLAAQLAEALGADIAVEVVATDGFLHPNAVLSERGVLMRKGYPETFDTAAMSAAVGALRHGSAEVPGYSHTLYDIDPALTRRIARPDVLILEGLGLLGAADALDLLIYIDADEADIERWYVDRFVGLWREAEHDPTSFYAQWRSMTEAEVAVFAARVWAAVNLPNLREHIVHARDAAHVVVRKGAGHEVEVVGG